MTCFRLILRSLWYYRWSNAAALAGMALTTAVITGALTVGESMRATLRDLAVRRLGNVTWALDVPGGVRAGLAGELAGAAEEDGAHVSCVIRERVAVSPGAADEAQGAIAANLYGIDGSFWPLIGADLRPTAEASGRSVVLNQRLADELGVQPGDSLILTLRSGDVSSAGIFATRELDDAFSGGRVRVGGVLPEGVGDFSLRPDDHRPLNLFADIAWVQRQFGMEKEGNLLLCSWAEPTPNTVLAQHLRLPDYGLRLLGVSSASAQLESEHVVLPESLLGVARALAEERGLQSAPSSVYLANSLRVEGSDREPVPYSVIASVESISDLGNDSIVLNQWTAEQLQAEVGDRIVMTLYVERPDGSLVEEDRSFTLSAVVPIRGDGIDARLVPELKGVTDAGSIGDWRPPFPVDLTRIREQDEAYWDEFRTTPKAFLSDAVLRQCWQEGGSFGANWHTALRLTGPSREQSDAVFADFGERLARQLADTPHALVFRPVRAEALAAARGSSDFGGLFLGLSMFLIGSAVLFVVLLFRLMAERRAAQTGVLLASGCGPGLAGRLVWREGAVLSVAGACLGLPLGVAYAGFLIRGINSGWRGVLGHTASLHLHVGMGPLLIGAIAGFAVAACSSAWGTRGFGRIPVVRLLFGWRTLAARTEGAVRGRTGVWAVVGAIVAVAQGIVVWQVEEVSAVAGFFGIGATVLLTLLAFFAHVLSGQNEESAFSRSALAGRSVCRHWLRSMLTVGLLSFAVFVVVTVAANRSGRPSSATSRESGTGGFALAARTDIHLPVPFQSVAEQLAETAENDVPGDRMTAAFSLRVREGDDASCLNMQRPVSPRVLGMPAGFATRGGFAFKAMLNAGEASDVNPWQRLEQRFDDGAIPAFVDADSAQWILRVGLGEDIEVPGIGGATVRLRVVGLFRKSIFAGDIVVGESFFVESFGKEHGYGMFLAECAEADVDACKQVMRTVLSDYAVTVKTTSDILAEFAMLQNTYLAAFHSLGGLGVLLGAFGLVILMLRESEERRAEFALLMAVGFRRTQVVAQILAESATLLGAGLLIGAVSALVAVAPHLFSTQADVPWGGLCALLAGVTLIGLVTCGIAASRVCGANLLLSLRRE